MIFGATVVGKMLKYKPVSTIHFVVEQDCYQHTVRKNRHVDGKYIESSRSEEIVSTNSNIGSYVGEQSAEELAESTMEPEKRTLKKITMEDAFRASNTFNSLMGESVTMRKRFIEDNAFKANVNI